MLVVILHFPIKCIIFTFTFRSLVHFRWLVSEVAVEALFFFPMCISICSAVFVENTIHLVSYPFVNNIMSLVLCFSLWMFDMDYKNERIVCFLLSHQYYEILFIYISIPFRSAIYLVIKIVSRGSIYYPL